MPLVSGSMLFPETLPRMNGDDNRVGFFCGNSKQSNISSSYIKFRLINEQLYFSVKPLLALIFRAGEGEEEGVKKRTYQ